MYFFREQRLTMGKRLVSAKDMSMSLSKQLQVFLLHARQDEESVRRLYRRLLKEGADVWLDQEKLLPGQDWVYEIHKAIENSDMVIACLSRHFNKQGGFRHEELRLALEKAASLPEGTTFLIPARLEKCELPEPLRRWQCVHLFEASGYKKLIRVRSPKFPDQAGKKNSRRRFACGCSSIRRYASCSTYVYTSPHLPGRAIPPW
jgi:hypothetical protein